MVALVPLSDQRNCFIRWRKDNGRQTGNSCQLGRQSVLSASFKWEHTPVGSILSFAIALRWLQNKESPHTQKWTLNMLDCFKDDNNVFPFCIISCSTEEDKFTKHSYMLPIPRVPIVPYTVDTIPADALALEVVRASAGMVFTSQS